MSPSLVFLRVIWPQLVRYAGYRRPDGSVTGDPSTVDLTAYLEREHGWRGPGSRFDVLPLLVAGADETTPSLLELPVDGVSEAVLSHPSSGRCCRQRLPPPLVAAALSIAKHP